MVFSAVTGVCMAKSKSGARYSYFDRYSPSIYSSTASMFICPSRNMRAFEGW